MNDSVTDNLKILVVDDTVTYRQILSSVVSNIQNTELMGTAPNGKIALSKIELSLPDLVLLDVSMPEMDGLEALQRIKKNFPSIEVVMVSGSDRGNANLTMQALNFGALDFIPKPEGKSPEESLAVLQTALISIISVVRTRKYLRQTRSIEKPGGKAITIAKVIPAQVTGMHSGETPPIVQVPPKSERKIGKIDVVALGVSTGGPNALQNVIPRIEKDFPLPIVAVQHMPPLFTASLAEKLDKDSNISVVEAKEGDKIKKGQMYIAPGGHHMVIRKGGINNFTVGIVDSPPVNSCRPSVDVLFRSVGMVFGGNVLTVILTGMGNDGTDGVLTIRRKGGYSIVQDETTSVVWGMPGSVVEAQAADEILPLDKIADRIMQIAAKGAN